MAYLVKPELKELSYRRKLHESKNTMSFQNAADSFPKEAWLDFYRQIVEADPKESLYRYIFCPSCNDFTGEVSWQYNSEKNRYEIQLLIQYEMRREGYGRKGLNLIKQLAQEQQIADLYAVVAHTNPAVGFFQHLKKEIVEEDQDTVTFIL